MLNNPHFCNHLFVNYLCVCVSVYDNIITNTKIFIYFFLLFEYFEIIILMFAWKIFENIYLFRFLCMGFSFNKALSLKQKIRNLLVWSCLCINATLQCFLWSYYMLSSQTDCELINHKEHLLGLTRYCQPCSRAKHDYLKSPRQSNFSVTGSRAQVACISPTPHLFYENEDKNAGFKWWLSVLYLSLAFPA